MARRGGGAYGKRPTLHDCAAATAPGKDAVIGGSELLIVEGESAALAVLRVRDPLHQAVLPMQGKPLNAWRANRTAVGHHVWLGRLIEAIGAGYGDTFDPARCRYDRIVMLFDPDADGIHIGALMMMFFQRWMPPLVSGGRLRIVRPPRFELVSPRIREPVHAITDHQLADLREELRRRGIDEIAIRHHRGLGSLQPEMLSRACVDPLTRYDFVVTPEDAMEAVRVLTPPT